MRDNDQIILENIYADKVLLSEKIVGNAGWVYHRTHTNPETTDIAQKGIKPSSNQSAMYGKGLYCCYDIYEQLKPEMEKYGHYILKGKINLNGFAILDPKVYKLANPRGNFEKHLNDIGTNIEAVRYHSFTSTIAVQIWEKCKNKGYNGIIFTGQTDGKVAVIWNRRNFIPYQYALDHAEDLIDGKTWTTRFRTPESLEWKKLNPNISSIQRPYDKDYDKDDEIFNYRKRIKELSEMEEIGDLEIPSYMIGKIYLKNVKVCSSIKTVGPAILVAPKLQKVSNNISVYYASEINLPSLVQCNDIVAERVKKINLPKLERAYNIYAEEATEINLPELRTSFNLDFRSVPKLDLPSLVGCINLQLFQAIKFTAPQLNTVQIFVANKLPELDLPELEKAWEIMVKNALTVKLPKLKKCDLLQAYRVENIVMPDAIKNKLNVF